ncbi:MULTISPECIES: hypothetical protein [Proteiniphilum]|jgi:hypothetical protein|uniref:hypothetical protein n=1 Tax=Proteiniphilum TaxID=294702 RepID=UPI001EEA0725|nr:MULTISPECIES: hypothetical protein [Proteiniphilum]ULB33609.1 hypothetical protein KDN43_11385 [Proteiniphilum propionicum]
MEKTLSDFRNVNLSEGTKQYIVAYRVANEAANITCKELERIWGLDRKEMMTDKLFRTLGEFQAEILRLMGLAIEANLREEDDSNEI